jgi:rSAM/selenodomain-associated transferase 2
MSEDSKAPWLSIIVPVLNEANGIQQFLAHLQPWREAGCELVVVDGGSVDQSAALAQRLCDRVVNSSSGRARQMNAGARESLAPLLLFLHADTALPSAALNTLRELSQGRQRFWGRFDVRLGGPAPLLRVVERMMNCRSRMTGIATGDQAIFVSRALFDDVGAYPDIELMEDIALSARLRRRVWPDCLPLRVETSARRWEQNGIVATILTMWGLRLAYAIGVSPRRLAAWYRQIR